VLEKIAAMPEVYRKMGERLHALIKSVSPNLMPRLWYGMPAYSLNDKVICFFRGAEKERYITLGFNPDAKLDDSNMWPIAFAVIELSDQEEIRIKEIVKKAVGDN
jgi:uncharacterized protein YdhG (YjbR/CyaY superfamily)